MHEGREWLLANYLRKWVIVGVLIGIAAGLGAILFFQSIQIALDLFLGRLAGVHPPGPRGEGETIITPIAHRWAIPLVTTFGGLLSGLIVFTLAPEAEGHGTDAAIEAFHQRAGRIRARIPAIKTVASAITIGSGGSAGREGPTAQIAAGVGSWLGERLRLSAEDRRIAVTVGLGAGIGAIFKAPLGGALLAAEILYLRDFELAAIVPGFIASVIGYSIFAAWSGWEPVFGSGLGYRFTDPASLGWYALLGLVCGVVGMVYVRTFQQTRDLFHKLSIPPHFKPAIGGLLVGLIAMQYPQILAMGYGWLQFAIEGDTVSMAAHTMLILAALKIVATALTVGSGGSGGVFAPGLFIGGMLGGGLWSMLHSHVPGMPVEAEPFVVVGMGALFGGIAKAPIAVMLMVAEMTGEFTMIVPAMIATSVAYLVSGSVTIYESQLPTRGDSPAHRGEFTIPLIQTIDVGRAMQPAPSVAPLDSLTTAIQLMEARSLRVAPVVEDDRLVGCLSDVDALRARVDGREYVQEAMQAPPIVTYATDSLLTALQRMTRAALGGLPVVERNEPTRLLGFITITDVARVLDLQVNALASQPETVRAAADDPLRFIAVEETMSRAFDTISADATLAEAARRFSVGDHHALLVVDADGGLTGIVTVPDLERATTADAPDETPITEVATTNVVTARVGQFVADALAQPGAEGARQLPVVSDRGDLLVPVGLLRRSDVVVAYLRGRERRAGAIRNDGGEVLSAEIPIERLDDANGLTLAELGLPPDTVVTAVERAGRVLVPRGGLRLLAGDRLRLLGSSEALPAALEHLRRIGHTTATEAYERPGALVAGVAPREVR
ncbi:MAG: chloride channel protein [Dehalococcoidia bacterium]